MITMLQHPCFHKAAGRWFDNLHLPVAASCNMKCHYCDRLSDCIHENRPGVASKVINPNQALDKVRRAVRVNPRLRVVGVAGPGDALANYSTFKTLARINVEYPHLIKCVSTNGLLLPDSIDDLIKVGVSTLTVTINSVETKLVARMIDWISYQEHIYKGEQAAKILLDNQLAGIRAAVKKGITVKVKSVLIPDFNDYQLFDVALAARRAGAVAMDIVPLLPMGGFGLYPAPTSEEIQDAREMVTSILPLSPSCYGCSAHAAG